MISNTRNTNIFSQITFFQDMHNSIIRTTPEQMKMVDFRSICCQLNFKKKSLPYAWNQWAYPNIVISHRLTATSYYLPYLRTLYKTITNAGQVTNLFIFSSPPIWTEVEPPGDGTTRWWQIVWTCTFLYLLSPQGPCTRTCKNGDRERTFNSCSKMYILCLWRGLWLF